MRIAGRWQITETELWDSDDLNLVAPAFSWEGDDDCDPVTGRGRTVLEVDGSLRGRIYFHLGDDSGFTAVREGRSRPGGNPVPVPVPVPSTAVVSAEHGLHV
jgi:hypothetical protein